MSSLNLSYNRTAKPGSASQTYFLSWSETQSFKESFFRHSVNFAGFVEVQAIQGYWRIDWGSLVIIEVAGMSAASKPLSKHLLTPYTCTTRQQPVP